LQLRNVKTIPVGANPSSAAASPTRNEIYVANADSSNVSIIDAERNQVVATVASTPTVLRLGFLRRPASLRRQFRFGECFRRRLGETGGHRDHSVGGARDWQSFHGWQACRCEQSRRRYDFHH